MNILLISSYPNNLSLSTNIFVYKLIQELIEQGNNVVVISPMSWRFKRQEFKSNPGIKKYGKERAVVYRPKYFDFPNKARIGSFTLGRYNAYTYANAVKNILSTVSFKPDIIYSHFLYRPGPAAILAAKYYKVPAVVALGESTLEKHETIYTKNSMKRLIHQFAGVISVSEKNKNYVTHELDYPENQIEVIPNAVDLRLFYQRDKMAMREKYDLPKDKFLVAFTGHFIERKGPLRVLKAINQIDNRDIGGIFIGSGSQNPEGEKVVFNKRVSLNEVPELLSAADIFVLPTLNEGSCNAIFEAMACGLPIVSSDIEEIREQVNEDTAILCNPLDIEAIQENILRLYDDKVKRHQMQKNSLRFIANNTIQNRTKRIIEFLNNK